MDKLHLLWLNESIGSRFKFIDKMAAESELSLRQKQIAAKLAL